MLKKELIKENELLKKQLAHRIEISSMWRKKAMILMTLASHVREAYKVYESSVIDE
mgnify:FL=1